MDVMYGIIKSQFVFFLILINKDVTYSKDVHVGESSVIFDLIIIIIIICCLKLLLHRYIINKKVRIKRYIIN